MITAVATGENGKLILLGLTYGNIERIMRGLPIDVSAETHPGFPEGLNICIFCRETEEDVYEQIRDLIGDDTKIVTVDRSGVPKEPS
jgi:hypothetical protein